jgi:hypothetical protein
MELPCLDVPCKDSETLKARANVCQLYNKFAIKFRGGFIHFVLILLLYCNFFAWFFNRKKKKDEVMCTVPNQGPQ